MSDLFILENASLTEVYRFLTERHTKPNGSPVKIGDVQQYIYKTKRLPKWMGSNSIVVNVDIPNRRTYNILK